MSRDDLWKETEEIRKRAAELAKQRQAEVAEERAEEARVYVVQKGDSLSKIAKEVYGDAARWKEIFEANKDQIEDPNLIRPGWELRIP
jgi:nucleoid-associated protein YgaU